MILFLKPVAALVQLALKDETSSHILLVPLISAWLLLSERNQSGASEKSAPWLGIAALLAAILAGLLGVFCRSCTSKNLLGLYALSLVLLIVAGHAILFGPMKTRSSSFSLSMLLFSVPIPNAILPKIIYWLPSGSAAIAEVFFNLSGALVLRDGFVFRLPRISIEVAQECSGIRSSLALLILALLVAHFSFRAFWKKSVFVLAGLCMMFVKKGICIASFTFLVDFLNSHFFFRNLLPLV